MNEEQREFFAFLTSIVIFFIIEFFIQIREIEKTTFVDFFSILFVFITSLPVTLLISINVYYIINNFKQVIIFILQMVTTMLIYITLKPIPLNEILKIFFATSVTLIIFEITGIREKIRSKK